MPDEPTSPTLALSRTYGQMVVEIPTEGLLWIARRQAALPGFVPTVRGVLVYVLPLQPRGPGPSQRRDRAIRRRAMAIAGNTGIHRITERRLDLVARQLSAVGCSRHVIGRVRTELRRAARAWALTIGRRPRVDSRKAAGLPLVGPPPMGSKEWSIHDAGALHAHLSSTLARAAVAQVAGAGVSQTELKAELIGDHAHGLIVTRLPSQRFVPPPPWVTEEIALALGSRRQQGQDPDRPLFGTSPATTLPMLLRTIREAQVAAGLDDKPPITWRALRDVFVRAARSAGVPTCFLRGRPTPSSWPPTKRLELWAKWSRFSAAWTDLESPPLRVPPPPSTAPRPR